MQSVRCYFITTVEMRKSRQGIYVAFENLEAIHFIKELNQFVKSLSGVMMIAEESTSYEGVTKPVEEGGLGFHFKWNMGWMNDSLDCQKQILCLRRNSSSIYFSMMYAFTENYIYLFPMMKSFMERNR